MKPELLKALEANMFDRHEYEALEAEAFLKGHHEYEALEAEAFLKGQASGVEKGALQERKKNDAEKLKIADFFRSKGVPEDIVSEGFGLK